MKNWLQQTNIVNYYVYISVFLSEFVFFFVLPIMGGVDSKLTAQQIAIYLTISVLLEGLLLFVMTGYFGKFQQKNLITTSLLLRIIGLILLICMNNPISWLIFLILIAVSKSISKPILRDIISKKNPEDKLKRKMELYALFQNIAIFIAPLLGWLSIKYNFIKVFFVLFVFINIVLLLLNHYYLTNNNVVVNNHRTLLDTIKIDLKELIANKNLIAIVLCMFLCFFIMGMFITATSSLPKFHDKFYNYSGLFFSAVGFSICVFQGFIFKIFDSSKLANFFILSILGLFSSVFLLYNFYIALASLIIYSLYEAITIPFIYYQASVKNKNMSNANLFSYMIISSSLGEAVGSYITGIITNYLEVSYYLFMVFVSIASIICSWLISYLKRV